MHESMSPIILMNEKIEIDPVVRGSPLFTAHDFAIKMTCRSEVMDRKGKMERTQAHRAFTGLGNG